MKNIHIRGFFGWGGRRSGTSSKRRPPLLLVRNLRFARLLRSQAFYWVGGRSFEGQDADGEQRDHGGEHTGGREDSPL
jgi:hypothetical protein